MGRAICQTGSVPVSGGGAPGVIRHAPPLATSKGTDKGKGECKALAGKGATGKGDAVNVRDDDKGNDDGNDKGARKSATSSWF